MTIHAFSDMEGLHIASEMEKRGESFYRRASRVVKSEKSCALLTQLADDEMTHLKEFTRLYEREAALHEDQDDEYYSEETSAYLSAIAADIVFPGGLMAAAKFGGFENPLAVIDYAVSSEKDSILFYTELALLTHDEHAKGIFLEIANQERGHMTRLLSMASQLQGK